MSDNAITQQENIVFETVGSYYVSWLIDKLPPEYEVYYAFTLLDFCENVRRNKTRAVEQMEVFIRDPVNSPAPRLPDVTETSFKMTVEKIGKNLWELLGRKLWQGDSDPIHHIIVFDNTTCNISVVAIENIKKVQHVRRCYIRTPA